MASLLTIRSFFTLTPKRLSTQLLKRTMAWRCTGDSNESLVNNLAAQGIIRSERVIRAMKSVDRGHYSPIAPYADCPQSIGYNVTISAPHMHGYALEALADFLKPGMKALDVGSGSGYLTCCMASMVGEEGKVIGIEHIEELNEQARKNVRRDHPEFLDRQLVFVTGDGRLGYPEEAPYDCIHVGAASTTTPSQLLAQLKAPGRMFVPVCDTFGQVIMQYDKLEDGTVKSRKLMGVQYVPLTDRTTQLSGYF